VTYLREKHRFRALGVDISRDLIPKDCRKESIPAIVARAEELPLHTGSCDGVLCECVLSLVTEPGRAVEEFSRVLRIGGCLILSDIYDRVPCDGFSSGPTTSGGCASALRSRAFVEKLLGDSEFELQVWEDHTRYLKELTAQLILSNDSQTEFHDLCGIFDAGCTSPAGSLPVRPGYYLLVAQKMKKGEAFHG
jgi:SAM-dependent methyltransferase